MFQVYVLKSTKDGNLYVGCTSNLEKRVKEHNQGRVKSTKNRRPLILIYKEEFADRYKAFRTEKLYKTPVGKRALLKKL